MLLALLAFVAVMLTMTLFRTKEAMLGFPCAIMWAITGAQSYLLSTVPWGDIYFYLFFASFFGMTIFTSLAAFGLREKRDTYCEEEADETEQGVVEGEEGEDTVFGEEESKPSRRTLELRERAKKRRSGQGRKKKIDWGEFR